MSYDELWNAIPVNGAVEQARSSGLQVGSLQIQIFQTESEVYLKEL